MRTGKPPSDYCQQVYFFMFMFSYFCSVKEDTDFVFVNRLINSDLSTAEITTDFIFTGESGDQARLPPWISRLGLVL